MGRIHVAIITLSVLSLFGLSLLVPYLKHLIHNEVRSDEILPVMLIFIGSQAPLATFLWFLKKQGIFVF